MPRDNECRSVAEALQGAAGFGLIDRVVVQAEVKAWMPGKGSDPPRPAPSVLTEEDMIAFLRLDCAGVKNPKTSLRYYRTKFGIVGVMIGRRMMFLLDDALALLEKLRGEAASK